MLSFFSLNASGLKNNVKRKATFIFCKEQKVYFFEFILETSVSTSMSRAAHCCCSVFVPADDEILIPLTPACESGSSFI